MMKKNCLVMFVVVAILLTGCGSRNTSDTANHNTAVEAEEFNITAKESIEAAETSIEAAEASIAAAEKSIEAAVIAAEEATTFETSDVTSESSEQKDGYIFLFDGISSSEPLSGESSNYSVYYDSTASETVCLRNGQEIGERIAVSPQDINEFIHVLEIEETSTSLPIGYKTNYYIGLYHIPDYCEETDCPDLVYPIVLDNDGQISFQLYKINFENELFCWENTDGADVDFCIANDKIYVIDNFAYSFSVGYCKVAYALGDEVNVEEIPIDYPSLTDITINQYDGKWIDVWAVMDGMSITGSYSEVQYSLYGVMEDGIFDEYVVDVGNTYYNSYNYYNCPSWDIAKEIIDITRYGKSDDVTEQN